MGVLFIIGGLVSIGLAIWTQVEGRETERRLRRGEIRMTWQKALAKGMFNGLRFTAFGLLGLVLIALGVAALAQ